MPSRIEELIAWGRKEVPRLCKLGNQLATARAEGIEDFSDMLERAYREEVVPMVKMFYRLKVEAAYAKQFVDNSLAAADLERAIEDSVAVLRRFDAPAGTDPKPTAEEKERYCPKHSPKGIVCDCDLAAEELRT